jgi:hypothetical protein
MRRGRDGEALEDDDQDSALEQSHDPSCVGGWLGDDEDAPVPCPVCRPHLVRRRHGSWARVK